MTAFYFYFLLLKKKKKKKKKLDSFPPSIIEVSVRELPGDDGQLYTCVVDGSPLPSITWTALNLISNSRQQVERSIPGIKITERNVSNGLRGRLSIAIGTEFEQPICVVENINGRVINNFNSNGK